MNRRQLRVRAERTLNQLDVSRPLVIDELRGALEDHRGKPIDLVPTTELPPRSAFAFTGSTASFDVVMYDARLAGLHRDLVILHEFAHMLLGHQPAAVDHSSRSPLVEQFETIGPEALAEVLGEQPRRRQRWSKKPTQPSLYDDPTEWEAETMATILLSWMPHSDPTRQPPEDPFEQILSGYGRI